MVRRLVILETYWYLAYQDGRADNNKYSTEKEAKEALAKLRKGRSDLGRDICIMSFTHEVEP